MNDSQGNLISIGDRAMVLSHDERSFVGRVGTVHSKGYYGFQGTARIQMGDRDCWSLWIAPEKVTVVK